MRVRRFIVGGMLIATIVVAAGVLQLHLYLTRPAEDELRKGEDIPIAALRPPLPENAFLACPPGYCQAAAAETPIFAVPVDLLAAYWLAAIAKEPRLQIVQNNPAAHRLVLIQHSQLFGFPDLITVDLIAIGPDHSSIAIYSRSRYGHYDFGVNRERVERWLARLEQIVAVMESRISGNQYNPPVPTLGPPGRPGTP